MSSIQISQVADVIDKWVQYCTPNEKKEFAEFTHEAKRTLDLIKSMEPGGDKVKVVQCRLFHKNIQLLTEPHYFKFFCFEASIILKSFLNIKI